MRIRVNLFIRKYSLKIIEFLYLASNAIIHKNIEHQIKMNVLVDDFAESTKNISVVLDNLYDSIPDNKRISFGRVYTIKITAKYIYDNYSDNKDKCFDFAERIFDIAEDYRVRGVALGVISFYG